MEKQTLFLPFFPDPASVRPSWIIMLTTGGSIRLFNQNLEVKKKGTNALPLQTLFLFRQTKLPGDALMVVEEGGGSAHAPLGEMCYSCLCGLLCSHGNYLSPLLFLKSTCLWEYHSGKKKKKKMRTPPLLEISQVNTSSSVRYLITWEMPN